MPKAFTNKKVQAIDLFCGVGGLTCGLKRAGIDVKLGVDIDPECQFAYRENNHTPMLLKDLKSVEADELAAYYEKDKIRLLAGCAPCQPFSAYSRKNRKTKADEKWELVSVFANLVEKIQPELITMENVPQLVSHDVFKKFEARLGAYNISWSIVDCATYGVPQTRKRLVLLASRLGPIRLLDPEILKSKRVTVQETIGALPKISAGGIDPKDPLHRASRLSSLNLQRIRASKPGGSWRDWDPSLLATCHRKTTGLTYPSVYGRMSWDEASPTLTTQCFGYGNGRFGHPDQDRAISLREAALLQTFPENYLFAPPEGKISFKTQGRLIGNAVPVKLAVAIGKSFTAHLENYP